MYGVRHHLSHDFPEYQHAIESLKTNSRNFATLFDEYDNTDKKIYGLINQMQPTADSHLETLKKKRLLLKDQLYSLLVHHNEYR
ncbi:MAG: YdcH family protein [Gammaproteobacteria bacterium]